MTTVLDLMVPVWRPPARIKHIFPFGSDTAYCGELRVRFPARPLTKITPDHCVICVEEHLNRPPD